MATLRRVALAAAAVAAGAASASAVPERGARRALAAGAPQVILVILADDLGYADVSYARGDNMTEHATPNIDALAYAGVRLNHHYAHFMCTPSRCAFLTGRLPMYVQQGQAFPETPSSGIPRNMTGLGLKMQAAGYSTHAVGKWDAGMATPTHTPEGRGFDTSLVYYEHMNDYWTQGATTGGTACSWIYPDIVDLWDTGAPAYGLNGTAYIEYMLEARVQSILTGAAPGEPLFIYWAPHTAHYPLEVPQEWYDRYDYVTDDEPGCNVTQSMIFPGSTPSQYSCRRQHDAMVGLLDAAIGNVTATLTARGLWNSTLILFSSDNGAPLDLNEAGGSNSPLRGGKYASWEGGIRTLGFVSGGYLPTSVRGTQQEGVVHLADWYGTFCAMGGVDPYDPVAAAAGLPPVQSVNVWPLISGANTTWPRTEIPVSPQTLIQWPYKLTTGQNAFATWQGPVYPNASSDDAAIGAYANCGTGCLYDLTSDPNEHNDISANNTALVAAMSTRLTALTAGFFSNNDTGVNACPANVTLLCGCWMAVNKWGSFLGPYQY